MAKHKEIFAQQIFDVQINSTDLLNHSYFHPKIVVHTSEVLFESRDKILLICRVNDQCNIEWIDQNNRIRNETDLIISESDIEEGMNLFLCQICCLDQCQKFNSFIYSVSQ